MHKILCTICARGGSKGIKHKNIRILLGRPLIAYTLEQALNWGKARHIIVSTDSEKIAGIARHYGAEAPFMRPKRLANDRSPKVLSIRHALLTSEKLFKERFDIVVDLDVTAPLRRQRDLDNCLNIFLKDKPKTLFSVVRAHRNPYFNMVERKPDGFVKLCKKLPREIIRRQNTPDVYDMNASIYFYSRNFLFYTKQTLPFSDKTSIYVMDDLSGCDIDSEADFKFIEFLMKEGIWKNGV